MDQDWCLVSHCCAQTSCCFWVGGYHWLAVLNLTYFL